MIQALQQSLTICTSQQSLAVSNANISNTIPLNLMPNTYLCEVGGTVAYFWSGGRGEGASLLSSSSCCRPLLDNVCRVHPPWGRCHTIILGHNCRTCSKQWNPWWITFLYPTTYFPHSLMRSTTIRIVCECKTHIWCFFLNPLLFASCTDTVKLLEAWRGVLSSTPPYK
jgi:hypothetical protein